MKLYLVEIYVGSYTITAIGDSPANTIKALVKEYRNQFGTFRENGFKNKADWLDYHGLSEDGDGLHEFTVNTAVTH